MSSRARQQGVALLSVLLICVLLTLVVSSMLARQRLSLYSSANLQQQQQLWQLALSGEAWAREQLRSAMSAEGAMQVTHLGQRWADAGHLQLGGGQVQVQISDLNARLNLNSLHGDSPVQRGRYQRLLAQLGLPRHDPSVLLGEQTLSDIAALRQLPEVSREVLEALTPLLVALPGSHLNINTAPAALLACIEGIDAVTARTLVRSRPSQGYANLESFFANPMLQGRAINPTGLGVSSRYFQAQIEVHWHGRRLRLLSTLHLGSQAHVQVLQRTLEPGSAPPLVENPR